MLTLSVLQIEVQLAPSGGFCAYMRSKPFREEVLDALAPKVILLHSSCSVACAGLRSISDREESVNREMS
jgi:hypothetical protein